MERSKRASAASQSAAFGSFARQPKSSCSAIMQTANAAATSEEGKGMNVAIDPGFGGRGRIGPDLTGIAVRQVEREEVRLLCKRRLSSSAKCNTWMIGPRWISGLSATQAIRKLG